MTFIIQFLTLCLPWHIRKHILKNLCGFSIEEGAKIGLSIISAKKVHLGKYSYYGHFNVCKKIDFLFIGENSSIGSLNFITGFSVNDNIVKAHGHFSHIKNRQCCLIIGRETGITSRHYFDCNGGIYIGDFCQIAGLGTHFLTHSIDIEKCRQDAAPIHIGDYCFIGTRSTILKGVQIPAKCVLGACSLANKIYDEEECLYAGVPAKKIKNIPNYKFLYRDKGFVK